MKHVFVISAYGESPYLEECIRSLEGQSDRGPVFICTSTPSDYLKRLSQAHSIPLYVREGTPSLKDDWNFCVKTAKEAGADLLTIAHQDDVYLPDYRKNILAAAGPGASLIFTAAENIDAQGTMFSGKAEKIKRLLRWPLKTGLSKTGFGKRLALAFGNSVPCPACTYNLNYCDAAGELFSSRSRFVIDWETLADLADRKGKFVYIKRPLIRIRLHEGQETARTMEDETRTAEERRMMERFHTKPVAELLMHFYRRSSDVYREKAKQAEYTQKKQE